MYVGGECSVMGCVEVKGQLVGSGSFLPSVDPGN